MVKSLSFTTVAEKDLEDIQDYYDKISTKLTDGFFKEFFLTLQYIEQNYALFQVRYRGVRIAPLYRFPYGIHYCEKGNVVVIYRVLHTKRYFK